MNPFTIGLMLTGGLINALGKAKANKSEAEARRANAFLMLQEADYMLKASEKDIDIYTSESVRVASENKAVFAKEGFNLSGSALDLLAQNAFKQSEQIMEMKSDAMRKANLMKLRAKVELGSAKDVAGLTGLQMAGTALDTASRIDWGGVMDTHKSDISGVA